MEFKEKLESALDLIRLAINKSKMDDNDSQWYEIDLHTRDAALIQKTIKEFNSEVSIYAPCQCNIEQ